MHLVDGFCHSLNHAGRTLSPGARFFFSAITHHLHDPSDPSHINEHGVCVCICVCVCVQEHRKGGAEQKFGRLKENRTALCLSYCCAQR